MSQPIFWAAFVLLTLGAIAGVQPSLQVAAQPVATSASCQVVFGPNSDEVLLIPVREPIGTPCGDGLQNRGKIIAAPAPDPYTSSNRCSLKSGYMAGQIIAFYGAFGPIGMPCTDQRGNLGTIVPLNATPVPSPTPSPILPLPSPSPAPPCPTPTSIFFI